jgi:hypothetical protein
MPRTHETAQRGPGEDGATDDRARRWYHFRPVPRRRTDLMGFNTTWWVLLWLILIVLAVSPVPWW